MDLRQLEMFLAVAENTSFTVASQTLHVAQSAISRKVAMLEEELGEQLFKRVNKKVYLTHAGEAMLRHARKIFQDLHNAAVEVSEISELSRGRLRIGAGMIACNYLLPPVLEKFKESYPKVDIQVVTGVTTRLVQQIRENGLDIGLLTLPVEFPDLRVVKLCSEELVVVTSPKHATLATKKFIRAAELNDHPLIIFQKDAYTRRILDAFFRDTGIQPRISMEAENVETMKPLVRINLGISILPLRAVAEEARRGELHLLRIKDYKLTREQGLVFHNTDHLPKLIGQLIRFFQGHVSSP